MKKKIIIASLILVTSSFVLNAATHSVINYFTTTCGISLTLITEQPLSRAEALRISDMLQDMCENM